MSMQPNDLLFFDELSPAEQERARAKLQDDPAWAEALAAWQDVRAVVRSRLEADLPDRKLLVLYALDAEGQSHHLTAAEEEALEAARPQLEQALADHPALRHVVERIQDERAAFDAAWAEHAEGSTAEEVSTASRVRRDRAPQASAAHEAGTRWAFRLGLGTALVVLAVIALFMLPRGPEPVTVAVAEDETLRTVAFADGSTARLAAGTQLTYTPAGEDATFNRTVALQDGRAFFDVATKPTTFVVETPAARTTVLGTRFGVETSTEETSVVLASGQVSVAARGDTTQRVTLAPGQTSRVRLAEAPTAPAAVNLNESLGWAGLFIFRSTPVSEAAQQLAQHYEVAITVDDALRDEAVTGTFEREQGISAILEVLSKTLNASVQTRADGTYRLLPAGQLQGNAQ